MKVKDSQIFDVVGYEENVFRYPAEKLFSDPEIFVIHQFQLHIAITYVITQNLRLHEIIAETNCQTN